MAAVLSAMVCGSTWAQNTSSVFGTVIDEGEQGWQYRASYDDDSSDINQRLHYQRAINGSLRWRLVGQVRETSDSRFDEDYVRGELVWQITPDGQDYQTGFRFELRHRFEDRPDEITVHWINQWKHFDGWTFRALLGASHQFGDNDADGLLIETRLSAYTSLDQGPSLGLEAYSDYGSTADWLSTDEQSHQIGPFAGWDLGNGWAMFTGVLFGLTDGSDDAQLRFRIGREF
jgi:hypothetical protein